MTKFNRLALILGSALLCVSSFVSRPALAQCVGVPGANQVCAGPAIGGNGQFRARALVPADLLIGSAVEAWDADLDALAANTTNGFWATTGAGTGATRVLQPPAAGITISNPAGTAGDPTFALSNDLAAVEGLAGAGIAIRSETDTWLLRTIGGTANEITVVNGDGVAGAPTISLPSTLAFGGKTITGGTFNSPEIVTPTGIVKGDVGLANVDNTSDATKNSATATLTGKTYDTAGVGNSFSINGLAATSNTGTGAVVRAVSPVISDPTITGVTDIQGATKFSTQSQPAQITSDQNDYNPSSVVCSSTTTLIINSDAARNITGFAGGVQGCDLYLFNSGGFPITLVEGSSLSGASNRFDFGANFVLASKSAAHLKYDGPAARWRNTTGSGSGGGGSGVSSITAGTALKANGVAGGTITTSGTIDVDMARVRPPRGHLWGMNTGNSAGDTTNDIDIFAGECASDDATNPILIINATTMTKRLDAVWAPGHNQGGRDPNSNGGNIGDGTWHLFAIMDVTSGLTDFMWSTSLTPTLPSGYTHKRRFFSNVRKAGSLIPYKQHEDDVFWQTTQNDSTALLGPSEATVALTVPTGIRVLPFAIINNGRSDLVDISTKARTLDLTTNEGGGDTGGTALMSLGVTTNVARLGWAQNYPVWTNTSGQIGIRSNNTPVFSNVRCAGYRDGRGRLS